MAYTKTTWAAGDTVTSTKLNKMEQGIYDASNSGGVFYIEIEMEYDSVNDVDIMTLTNNVTGQQILDAINNGIIVAEKISLEEGSIVGIGISFLKTYTAAEGGHYFEFSGTIAVDLSASSLSENLTIDSSGGGGGNPVK